MDEYELLYCFGQPLLPWMQWLRLLSYSGSSHSLSAPPASLGLPCPFLQHFSAHSILAATNISSIKTRANRRPLPCPRCRLSLLQRRLFSRLLRYLCRRPTRLPAQSASHLPLPSLLPIHLLALLRRLLRHLGPMLLPGLSLRAHRRRPPPLELQAASRSSSRSRQEVQGAGRDAALGDVMRIPGPREGRRGADDQPMVAEMAGRAVSGLLELDGLDSGTYRASIGACSTDSAGPRACN